MKKFILICFIIFLSLTSAVHAEIKNFTASGTATLSFGEDDEKIVNAVKNIAKMRAEIAAKEKIFAYIKTANKNLTDAEISAVTNNISENVGVNFEKFSVSENAFESDGADKKDFMFEATVEISIDTEKISAYIALGKQEKENIIQQNKILQKSAALIDKNFDELAENFTAEELEKNFSAQQKLVEGNKFYFQQDFQNALASYNDAIQVDENFSPAYVARGLVNKNLKNYAVATENFQKAVELDNDAQAYYFLGQCFDILKNYDDAIKNFSAAIKFDSANVAAYQERGNIFYRQKNYLSAAEDFSKVIEFFPKNAKIYLQRGLSLKNLGNFDAAVEDFTKAIQLNQNYVYAYLQRGLVHQNLQNYSAAIEDFTKAIQLDTNYASAYHNRGLCYKNLGNEEKAKSDLEKARKLGDKE